MSNKVPGTDIEADELERAKQTLEKHKTRLLAVPGCTGVGIGLKTVKGEKTKQLAIVIWVKDKLASPQQQYRIPKDIDGVSTDVVEREEAGFDLIATDPFARFDTLFSGISITPFEAPPAWGSIGCFITTPGFAAHGVAKGDYLLTCQHVLKAATPPTPSKVVIQPKYDGSIPPDNYRCADYVYGVQDALHDCAIALVTYDRGFENKVPNYPWYPGKRTIQGVASAAPGQAVYKYGATSKFTKGTVNLINYNPPNLDYQNVILIDSELGQNYVWVARGDSGSVTILQSNDMAIGLNFAGDPNSVMAHPPDLPAYPAYNAAFAYDLQAQMNAFSSTGGGVVLA
jgi:hypothetical protein